MIEVINDYYIDVNDLNYTLKKDRGTYDKHGNRNYKTYGYYDSLRSALIACVDQLQRDKLSSDTFTLQESIKAINDVTSRFNNLLGLAIKEVADDRQ